MILMGENAYGSQSYTSFGRARLGKFSKYNTTGEGKQCPHSLEPCILSVRVTALYRSHSPSRVCCVMEVDATRLQSDPC